MSNQRKTQIKLLILTAGLLIAAIMHFCTGCYYSKTELSEGSTHTVFAFLVDKSVRNMDLKSKNCDANDICAEAELKIEGYRSETAEIVGEAIRAGIGR